ncbi:DUF1758 domain-containing protein [Trichonephila clavipes]|nr:DUF1758 domain-containing protein [Trichonephila clavipes]
MQTIEKIRAKRKTVRSASTKFVNKVKSFLETFDSQNETHQEQLSEYLLNLDAKQIELQTLNKEVEDLLSNKELFESEIEGSLEYEENINEVRYKIKSFALTEDNYKSCLNLLKDRYGRQDHLIRCYMNKLLETEPVESSFNLKRLRKLHDESEINIRSLDSMGITSENYRHLLIPIMLKQLPHDLVVEFHRQKDSKNIGDVRELMKFIKFEIESRESANIALGLSQKIPENSRYPPRNLSYQ